MDKYEINRRKSGTSIVRVMREHGIELKEKRGGEYYMCRCPFHDDKHPSMIVNPEKNGKGGHYYCYACGESGDVIKFVQKREYLTFTQALERLKGQSYSYTLPKNTSMPKVVTQQQSDPQKHPSKERLKKNEEFLKRLIPVVCKGPKLTAVYREYEVGYCPWLEDGDAKGYEKFRCRYIFPFRDSEGRLIGFLGRKTKFSHPDAPKYINSSEGDEFYKGNNLYGLDKAKDTILATGNVLVTEGPKDCIAIDAAGIHNVVALCTSHITKEQIELLKKYNAKRVCLMLDGDDAGRSGMLKAMSEYGSQFEAVRMLILPEGEDPDSLYLNLGHEALARYVNHLVATHPTEDKLFAAMLFHNDRDNGGVIGNQAGFVTQTLDSYGYVFRSKEYAEMFNILKCMGGEGGFSKLQAMIAETLHMKYDPGMNSRIEKLKQRTSKYADSCVLDFEKLLYLYLEHRLKSEIHDLNVKILGHIKYRQKDDAVMLQEVADERGEKLKDVMTHLKFLETNPRYRV